MTCGKVQEFLEQNEVTVSSTVDAKKNPIGRKEALALAAEVDEIYASKGKKVVHLDLKGSKPTEEEITDLILGPTGNLRAPTMRRGRTLLVGFDQPTYARVLAKLAATAR